MSDVPSIVISALAICLKAVALACGPLALPFASKV